MNLNATRQIWEELTGYLTDFDRAESAEVVVSILIDNDATYEAIRTAFKNDSDIMKALDVHMGGPRLDEEDDDEEEYYERYDEDEEDDEEDDYYNNV